MTWDYPPTGAGKYQNHYPPTTGVQITGGPDRTSTEKPEKPPVRRYVGFKPPSEDEPEESGSFPGVW